MDKKTIELNGIKLTMFSNGSVERPFYKRTKITFGYPTKGYMQINLKGTTPIAMHRLMAMAFLGDWDPSLSVNHINGNKSDNRIENLEMSTPSKQMHSFRAKPKDCSSIYRGVCEHTKGGKYMASCHHDHKRSYLGLFEHARDAALAYNRFASANGFSEEALNVVTPYRVGILT